MSKPPPLPPRSPSAVSTTSSWSSDEPTLTTLPRKDTVHLTPQVHVGNKQNHPYGGGTGLDDLRTSSLQSLHPVESAGSSRRTLLLIYIHGFMGTETSFKSFPAHVHNLLTITLSDSHVVHTKIYPRYQSRRNISFARDAFSNWLTPHESDNTDVILIGHSLGGILAAEVAIFPCHRPGSKDLFQHRILGHIAFDTPFLGMHPGVVSTGIASLFKPTPEISEPSIPTEESNSAPLSFNPFQTQVDDPNYNPEFPNDTKLAVRKNKLDQAFYFLNKHGKDWRKAATSYVKSHLEFGGCLADYDGLKKRYNAFRPLEDVDELASARTASGKVIPRVRFVNYYTASTGRIKQQKPPDENKTLVAETEMQHLHPGATQQSPVRPSTPRIAVEEHTRGSIISKDIDIGNSDEDEYEHPYEFDDEHEDHELQQLDPIAEPISPIFEEDDPIIKETESTSDGHNIESPTDSVSPSVTSTATPSIISSTMTNDVQLPPLPSPPTPPAPFDATAYSASDTSTLKLAQKEHERLTKSYERAKKDYDKIVRDREKHLAKLEKQRAKEQKQASTLSKHEQHEQERLQKEAERMAKEKERLEGVVPKKDQIERPPTVNQEIYNAAMDRQIGEDMIKQQKQQKKTAETTASSMKSAKEQQREKEKAMKKAKPPRDRKFCTLPSKDSKTGQRDATWIRVYMENMDEVVAHTSLFFVSETYAKLVGDTAERIESWVRESDTVRAVKEAQEWERAA